jgi:hypothetical protein
MHEGPRTQPRSAIPRPQHGASSAYALDRRDGTRIRVGVFELGRITQRVLGANDPFGHCAGLRADANERGELALLLVVEARASLELQSRASSRSRRLAKDPG